MSPHSWRDRPALIESLFPVQKLSVESFKEQMAGSGKTLTALGSYWKGRKPLVLNKACILGCLMPSSHNPLRDLEVFELLMGMDDRSLAVRHGRIKPDEMGIARFGHRPKVADVFCGSGQIPFEAARLGCDVYASDLNPIACMLTWGAFNIVGAAPEKRAQLVHEQKELAAKVQSEIDALGVEDDGKGWRAKVFLYCLEVVCPESGWKVPLLPTLIISKGYRVIAELVPIPSEKRYDITLRHLEVGETPETMDHPTVVDGHLVHSPDGENTYRTSLKAIRGDYKEEKENRNRLRLWEKEDFIPRPEDTYQERLYAIQWMRRKPKGKQWDYEFRSVTEDDLKREQIVINYVAEY